MDSEALVHECPQVRRRHVLVVEGQHVHTGREAAQRIQVGVMAEGDVRGDEGRGLVGRDREHAQRLAECDGGLLGHPGQLAAAHHADDGQAGNWVHEQVTLPASIPPATGRR
jgi:hypothetical protein